MRALTGALAIFGGTAAVFLFLGAGGCSIETKASDVICVKDQIDICTNCERPEGDTRPYRGKHKCAADGKSFGECMQCAPVDDSSGSASTDLNDDDDEPGGGGSTTSKKTSDKEGSGGPSNKGDPGTGGTGTGTGSDLEPECAELAACCSKMKDARQTECRAFVSQNSGEQCRYHRNRYLSYAEC